MKKLNDQAFNRNDAINLCIYLGDGWRHYLNMIIRRNFDEMTDHYINEILTLWKKATSIKRKPGQRIEWDIVLYRFLDYHSSYDSEKFNNTAFALSLKSYFDDDNLTKEILLDKIKGHLL